MMMEKICLTCGKPFLVYPHRKEEAKYCSIKCRRTGGFKQCLFCGAEFYFSPSRTKRKFCSPMCTHNWNRIHRRGEKAANWKGGKIPIKCLKCDTTFYAPPSEHRKYCSRKCAYAEHSWKLKKAYAEGRHLRSRYFLGKNFSLKHRQRISQTRKLKHCPNPFHKGHHITPKGMHRSSASEFKKGDPRIPPLARAGRLKQIFPKKFTSIEVKMHEELKSRGIEFKTNSTVLGLCQPDIVLPEQKIAIFCDGDYWHNLLSYRERDARQNRILSENGWRVLRFWEHKIKSDVGKCGDSVTEVMNN